MLKLDSRTHITISHFKQLKWFPVTERCKQICLTHVFKFVNSLSPSYMSDLLEFSPASKYTTRQSKTNFINVPHVRTKLKQQSFSYLAPSLWNKLPNKITECKKVTSFKYELKKHIYSNLENLEECNYIFNTNFGNMNMY